MKYTFIYFFSILLQILALREKKPKFCVNCKFFIKDHDTGKYGKCHAFPKTEVYVYKLVTGVNELDDTMYEYCSIARGTQSMCGK